MSEESHQQSAVRLRRRAAHCLRLAQGATSEAITAEFRVMAQSFETEANEIERRALAAPTYQGPFLVDSRTIPE